MFRIAVVDDERSVYETLKEYLDRYSAVNKVGFDCVYYDTPLAFFSATSAPYDIIFLDIRMPVMSGMEMAKKIRQTDQDVSLVFVTSMKQYGLAGYEVGADDFILKPVSYFDFAMKLDFVLKKILRRQNVVKIQINDNGILRFLSLTGIRYVEVARHRVTYHVCERSYETRGALNKIEELFLKNNFARCNNFCLVNLKFVTGVEGQTLFVSKGYNVRECDELAISRPRKKEFVKALNRYIGAETV